MSNENTIAGSVFLNADKEIKNRSNGRSRIILEVNRNTIIRIKGNEPRKQGDKDLSEEIASISRA